MHFQDVQGTREALVRQWVRSGEPVRKENDLKISPFQERFQRQCRICRHCGELCKPWALLAWWPSREKTNHKRHFWAGCALGPGWAPCDCYCRRSPGDPEKPTLHSAVQTRGRSPAQPVSPAIMFLAVRNTPGHRARLGRLRSLAAWRTGCAPGDSHAAATRRGGLRTAWAPSREGPGG